MTLCYYTAAMNLQEAIEKAKSQADTELIPRDEEKLNFLPLLGKTTYLLNRSKSKFVCVGIVPNEDLVPIVKLCGVGQQCVVLDTKDWYNLLEIEPNIVNYFQHGQESQWVPYQLGSKTLSFMTIAEKKVIKIEKGDFALWLGWPSIMQLFALSNIIKYQLELLQHAHFEEYYNDIIQAVAGMAGEVKVNIMNILTPLKDTKAENVLYMMEVLQLLPQKVHYDVEIARAIKE